MKSLSTFDHCAKILPIGIICGGKIPGEDVGNITRSAVRSISCGILYSWGIMLPTTARDPSRILAEQGYKHVLLLAKAKVFRLGDPSFNPKDMEPFMAIKAQLTITLKQIAADLADKHEVSKKLMNEILSDDLVEALVNNLKKGNRVRLGGLGILQVKARAARTGRNPATGETIQIPAKKKIAFRPAKELKESVGA